MLRLSRTTAAVSALVIFLLGSATGGYLRDRVADRNLAVAQTLLNVANDQVTDLRASLALAQRQDDARRVETGRLAAAARRTDATRRASAQRIPEAVPLPASCDPCVARATALQAALLDAEVHIDTLEALVVADSLRARELRRVVDAAQDSLAVVSRAVREANGRISASRRPTRLVAFARAETGQGRPIETMAGLAGRVAGPIEAYAGLRRSLDTGAQDVVIGATARVRIW
jgi:hypothetical protein